MIPNDEQTEIPAQEWELRVMHAQAVRENAARLARFLVGGNAGGTIATLSVVGTFISRPEETQLPTFLFWLVVTFVCGLVSSWVHISAELVRSRVNAFPNANFWPATVSSDPARLFKYARRVAGFISGLCMAAGTVGALLYLYSRTS